MVESAMNSAPTFAAIQFRLDGTASGESQVASRRPSMRDQAWTPQPHQHWHWHDGTLSPNEFLRDVQREKRRAERSKSPLSLVSYRLDEKASRDPRHMERLLAALHRSKRETDALGHVGESTVAVLCPSTDEAGAQSFIRKFESMLDGLPCSVLAATYPDDLFESLSKGVATDTAFQPFLASANAGAAAGEYPIKRVLDIGAALLALLLFSPLILAIAAAVKLTSRGPIIYKQSRMGKNGVPFTFYKFRSMVANVDDRIHREYVARLIAASSESQPAGNDRPSESFKLKNDPRITRVGRLIRTTSIDELPQLFNVLKGDMSMVGPRPPIPYEVEKYEPWHLRRILTVRPGITGLWQVEGRSRVTFSEMVRMDLRYIRNCSLTLDLKIMLKTIVVVIRCDGAS